MEQFELQASLRQKIGKGASHQLRAAGNIPAVYYGKGEQNLHIAINPIDLERAVASEAGMNVLIKLKIAGSGDHNALIKAYQAHPIKRNFTHADFVHLDLQKPIQIKVPIQLVGRPEGLKEGGILEHVTRELEIRCLPTQIPKNIHLNVEHLKLNQNLHLSDIQFATGVEPVTKINLTIASVMQPREVVETPAVMTEPEVLTAKAGEEGKVAGAEAGKEEKAGDKPDKGKDKAKDKADKPKDKKDDKK